MKIAIIGGSGRMGRWFANFLLKDGNEVIITGRNQRKLMEVKQQLGVEVATNAEAVNSADAILISVPIDNFEGVVEQIKPYTHPEQLIMDITSVKVFPVEMMHKHIKTGLVLGAHPVFGPGAKDITNHSFILTPTNNGERTAAGKIRRYLETRGAKVALMTPDEHDELMTVILGLSHFIAIVSADTLLGTDRLSQMREIGGITFRVLLTLVESVISEDPELYASLQMSLPGTMEIEELFQRRVKTWADLVKNRDKQGFAQRMDALKNRLEKVVPDFGEAYENMYRVVEGL